MSKALVSYGFYIHRREPRTGFYECIWFTGSLRQKPTGWKVGKPPGWK